MKTTLVTYLILVILLTSNSESLTSVCGTSDSYWEVHGNKQDNTLTCTGLSAQDTVHWDHWVSPTDSSTNLGECPPRPADGSQSVCSRPLSPDFIPNRISDDTSVMVINAVSAPDTRLFDKGRLRCKAVRQMLLAGTTGCRLDYIYAGTNTSCTVQFRNDTWSVFGQCITERVYSAQNRYRCEWIQTKESSREEMLIANTSMTVVPSVGKYVDGWCNMTSYLPSVGQYTYRVTLVPGEVTVNASFVGNNTTRRPSSQPSHNCPQYVPEGDALSCTCSVSDVGSPPGVLQWNTTTSAELRVSAVQAGDTGTHTCQLLWNNTVVQSVEYTLTVAYGPKSVTPVVVSPLPFDTNGSQNIGLNCSVSGSNPSSTITWIRSDNQGVLCNTQLCSLTPKPPDDDGAKIECLATNPVTNSTNSSSVTLALNYPPTSAPVMTGNPALHEGQPVYEGDSITLTCTVRGGKPSNATVITFTCPNKTDTPDSSLDSSSVTSSLTFDPVTSYNHGNCSCTASWKSYNWYKQKFSWGINVYTPPSVPLVFPTTARTGRIPYPFLENTIGTLHCQSNQTGRPEATYSWPVPATGHTSGSTLTFYNLTREDNGRTVKCRASNTYTENRRPVDDATFVLWVYYNPEIVFTSMSITNDCLEVFTKPNIQRCVVAEGKRVHFNCAADSNPPPASFKWLHNNFYSNTSELLITSANNTINNGDYNCTVITKQDNNDNRLPLVSSAILSVIVGYSPRFLTFSINSLESMTVSIMENSRLDMKCLCNGRPAPNVRLISGTDAVKFLNHSQPSGDMSTDEQTVEVTLSISQVLCEASGVYRCDANNILGQESESRMLLVSCAPRGIYFDGNRPIVSTTNSRGELNFRMTAYPTPMIQTLTYLGTNETSVGHPAKENVISVECSGSSLTPAAVTCTIRVNDITHSDEGFYRLVLSNSLGELPFIFSVQQAVSKDDQQTNTKTDEKTTIAVLAVVLASVVVVNVVFVIWLWRRRWSLPCAGKESSSEWLAQQNQGHGDASDQYLSPVTSKECSTREGQGAPLYDALQMRDVGKISHYEEIRRYQNAPAMSPYQGVMDALRTVKEEHTYVN